MRFSYLTSETMRELYPVGCRVVLKSSGAHPTILTVGTHPDTRSPYELRYSTTLKSGPAVNVCYPKSWKLNHGGWIFAASLRLVGKCAVGTCNHRSS